MFLDIGENCSEEKSRSFVFCLSSWMDEKYGRFMLEENYLKNGIRVMRLDIYIQDYENMEFQFMPLLCNMNLE